MEDGKYKRDTFLYPIFSQFMNDFISEWIYNLWKQIVLNLQEKSSCKNSCEKLDNGLSHNSTKTCFPNQNGKALSIDFWTFRIFATYHLI